MCKLKTIWTENYLHRFIVLDILCSFVQWVALGLYKYQQADIFEIMLS